MAYNEGRHHPIGKEALQKHVIPFLQNKPLSIAERMRGIVSSLFQVFRRDPPHPTSAG
jgi:hypothetical protein